MQVQNVDHMFGFTFEKSAEEITRAASKKAGDIRAKIEERIVRVQKMRAEHRVTDAVWIDIQNQMRADHKRSTVVSYSTTVKSSDGVSDETITVGAGVVNFIVTEQDFIGGEKVQAERLDLITRNLRDVKRRTSNGTEYVELVRVSYDEMKFLGF